MTDTMRFSLIGDDRLSPTLNHAGDMAVTMAGRITLAATESDLAMSDLTRDLEYRIRDARGEVIPESEALGRVIAANIASSADEILSELHPMLQVDADSRPADAEVRALFDRIEALRDAQIGVTVPVDNAIAELGAIRSALEDVADTHVDPDVQVNATSALFAVDLLQGEVDRLDADRATVDVDIETARALGEAEVVEAAIWRIGDNDGPNRAGRRFGILGSMVGRVGGALGGLAGGALPILHIAAAAGTAIPLIATLLTTLVNLAPAAGLIATGMFMAVSASTALKIGMSGVGDAVKAALDPGTKAKDLAAALHGLAPEARSFVMQLHSMRPAFDGLKLSVQSQLFSGMGSTVRTLGKQLLPTLRNELTTTAFSLNVMGMGVADAAGKLAKNGTLGKALDGANAGLWNLSAIPGHIVTGLVQVAAAAAPAFNRLTDKAGGAVDKLFAKLDKAFQSGGMQKAIDGAIGLFGQLFHVVGNVVTILGNVFGLAATGGNAFSFLGQVTDELVKVSAMPGVQAAFSDLFTVMAEVGKVAAPLLGQAVKLLAPVLVALAPPALRLIDSLGAGLQPVITALGPVVLAAAGAVAALVDAASPLLPVAGQLVASLGPVLTPILRILGTLFADLAPILGRLGQSLLPPMTKITGALAKAFTLMAPVIDKAVQQLGDQGLTPIISGLSVVLEALASGAALGFINAIRQLLPLVPMLMPELLQMGKSVGQILMAVAPLVPQLTALSVNMLNQLLPAVIPLIPPLVQLEVMFLRLATAVITKIVIPSLTSLISFMSRMQKAMAPAVDAVKWVTTHIASLFEWLSDHLVGHSVIPDMVNKIVSWLTGLPGKAARALASLPGQLGSAASSAARRMIDQVSHGVTSAVSTLGTLAGKARNKLGDLGGVLYKSGQSLISGFISGIASMAKSAASAAGSVLDKVKGFFPNSPAKEGPFSGRGWTLYSGQAVVDDWAAGMLSSRSGLLSAVGAVTGAAADAIPPELGGTGLGISAGAAAGVPHSVVTIPITINGALDPIAVAKQIQQLLLNLKRVSGVNIDLGLGVAA